MSGLLPFGFASATEILFGRGQSLQAAGRIAGLGGRVLLVQGGTAARADWLAEALLAGGADVTRLSVAEVPDMAVIDVGVAQARDAGVQVVAALGGGAVIDAGKAIAALVPASRPMLDHLEVVGQGLPLDHAPLPFVALPTTAGTGAEVTRNAVIGVPDQGRKVSLRDARMLPRLAIVDPALTDHCPRGVSLASGLDALTQGIEPFVSTRANPLTDALCAAAIPLTLTLTLADWARDAGRPGLTGLGVTLEMRAMAARSTAASSSMKANPSKLSEADLAAIMAEAA